MQLDAGLKQALSANMNMSSPYFQASPDGCKVVCSSSLSFGVKAAQLPAAASHIELGTPA